MSYSVRFRFVFLLFLSLSGSVFAQSAINPHLARDYFIEAADLAAADEASEQGALWVLGLEGPMVFVERGSRQLVANQQHPEGLFREQDGVFVGTLPEALGIANYAFDWGGIKWTMLIWPLPPGRADRLRLLAHEMWHRIQDQLDLPARSPNNSHLETREGRAGMRLEWRALERALMAKGDDSLYAIEDALIFRAWRRARCGDQATLRENALEHNEGLAEYTGIVLSRENEAFRREAARGNLLSYIQRPSLTRSFAYASGPAYGLLLDTFRPQWREEVDVDGDLGELLTEATQFDLPEDLEAAFESRLDRYSGSAILAEESRRDELRRERLARYQSLFVDGLRLVAPIDGSTRYTYDPGRVFSFDDKAQVYETLRVSADWGIMEVRSEAMLLWHEPGRGELRVVAPSKTEGSAIEGNEWTLTLADGWKAQPGERDGDWILSRQ